MPLLIVPEDQAGQRLDLFLTGQGEDVSRSRVQKLIKAGGVKVGGVAETAPKFLLKAGDRIEFEDIEPPEPPPSIVSVTSPLEVHYDDNDLLVVYKPPGLATHPSAGHYENSLVHWLMGRFELAPDADGMRPGIVHRLDMDTSGLLVVAKNARSLERLSEQFKEHSVGRSYFALVWGLPTKKSGTVMKNIGVNPANRKKMGVVVEEEGRPAITHWKVLEELYPCALLDCTLETGRTHQIRVHLSWAGSPLVGDITYGKGKRIYKNTSESILNHLNGQQKQMLHAYRLSFNHPKTGHRMNFLRRPPNAYRETLEKLGSAIDFESPAYLKSLHISK